MADFVKLKEEIFEGYRLKETNIIIEGNVLYGDSLWCEESNVYCFRYDYEMDGFCYRVDYRYDGIVSAFKIDIITMGCTEW